MLTCVGDGSPLSCSPGLNVSKALIWLLFFPLLIIGPGQPDPGQAPLEDTLQKPAEVGDTDGPP